MEYRVKYNTDFAYNRIPLSVNYLKWPPYLNMSILPAEYKSTISNNILAHCEQWLKYYRKEKFARIYLEEWDQIKRLCDYIVTSSCNNTDKEDFYKFIDEYDQRRNTNFREVFPEYTGIL